MIIIYIFITLTIILLFIYKKWLFYTNSISVKSKVDNKYYIVRDTNYKQHTADTLAIINLNVKKLFNILQNELNKNNKYNENIFLLIKRYNPNNIMENIDLQNTTYTVNKGKEVSVCLATRHEVNGDNKIYDINVLMFVVIHELSHIGCKSHGHNQEFKDFFVFLLKKSIESGIYKYQNYSKQPVEYCGMMINTTPI